MEYHYSVRTTRINEIILRQDKNNAWKNDGSVDLVKSYQNFCSD